MSLMKRRKIIILLIFVVLLLTACRVGADRYELTNYIGKSVSTFEKRSGAKLSEQSNGVYMKDGVVQVIAPEKKVNSVTLMKKAGDYSLFGVKVGMSKAEADQLIQETFSKETSRTINSDTNCVTYSYIKEEKELYISYDIDSNKVVELSYYKADSAKDENTVTQKPENSGQLIAIIGDTRVYYNEAMVYLKSAQEKYETEYGKDIWNADILGNGENFGTMIKEEVIKQITELKIIRAEAEELGISLTEDEQADAANYAKEHYKGLTEKDRQKYLITEDLLKQVYSDNLLANKVFETETINVDTKVADEDAKQITVQDVYIQNYNLDSEGKKVALSAQENSDTYEKVQGLLEKAKITEDFKAFAEANTEADTVEYTFGRGEGPKDFGDVFEQAAFTLKSGELSDIITTDSGWHILYCVTDNNKDATIQKKEKIIEKRRNDLFSELYKKWSSDYEVVVNTEEWNNVSLTD